MILENLLKDKVTYAHIVSAMDHPHKMVICPFRDAIIIHCTISNVFVVEYFGTDFDKICNFLMQLPIIRLQTTNKEIYQRLISKFKYHYSCVQVVYPDSNCSHTGQNNLINLKPSDLSFVQESYEMKEYIGQLYERKRLFGWYENQQLVGYVALHIDETVGALYVKPEFRKLGYGAKIMEAGFCKYENGIRYSQILENNTPSIELHKKIKCTFSSTPVFWVYNEEFQY